MCNLFNFPGGLAHCHDDIREGLVRTVRMVLHEKFPSLATEGFMSLISAPPVLYITSSTYTDVANYVCTQLGLPTSAVRLVGTIVFTHGIHYKTAEMTATSHISQSFPPLIKCVFIWYYRRLVSPEEDVADGCEAFQKIIDQDKNDGKTPLICIANVHSTLFQKQNVMKLQVFHRIILIPGFFTWNIENLKNSFLLKNEGHLVLGFLGSIRMNSVMPCGGMW